MEILRIQDSGQNPPPSINHEIRNVIKMLFKNSVALLKSSLPLEGNGGVSENGSEDD